MTHLYIPETDGFCHKFYPSVDCGPISIEKGRSLLDFNPTPLDEVVEKSVKFFENAMEYSKKYADEKNEMFDELEEAFSPPKQPQF